MTFVCSATWPAQPACSALFIDAVVATEARLPSGGTGRSEYGRELSEEGVAEFINIRTT